jgi:hypothetical protein
MRDFLNIGPTPPGEDCQQLGAKDYDEQKAKAECQRYIDLLRKTLGDEPEGARLAIKGFDHDFGRYYEVVCYYYDREQESVNYAYRCEGEGPEYWEDKND